MRNRKGRQRKEKKIIKLNNCRESFNEIIKHKTFFYFIAQQIYMYIKKVSERERKKTFAPVFKLIYLWNSFQLLCLFHLNLVIFIFVPSLLFLSLFFIMKMILREDKKNLLSLPRRKFFFIFYALISLIANVSNEFSFE